MDIEPQNTMTVAAVSSVVTAILMWVSGKGWPVIKEACGLMSDREKSIRDQAKEGPLMVLERVEREYRETKETLAAVVTELKEWRQKHHDCETAHSALKTEVQYLKSELQELKEGK